jgi:hypothetical protein
MNTEEACQLLNISLSEINKEILKQKYRIAILKYHPDRLGGNSEEFIKVKEAYELLQKEIKEDTPLDYYIQLIKNFNYSLVDTFIVEPIVNYLKKVTYELTPSLNQLLNKSVFFIPDHNIYVPLWHTEITFKNITININPILPDNIIIDNDNNIHIIITEYTETFILGTISFLIQDCIKNMNLLKGRGIPRINMKNIYDYSELSDIILHFRA